MKVEDRKNADPNESRTLLELKNVPFSELPDNYYGPAEKRPELQKITEALQSGNFRSTAARMSGVNPETLEKWIGQYPKLGELLAQAEAEGEALMVMEIRAAGAAGNWKANAYLLGQRHPERWNQKAFDRPDEGKKQIIKSYGDIDLEQV